MRGSECRLVVMALVAGLVMLNWWEMNQSRHIIEFNYVLRPTNGMLIIVHTWNNGVTSLMVAKAINVAD